MNSRWYLIPLSAAVIVTTCAAFGTWAIFVAPLIILLAPLLNGMRIIFRVLLVVVVIWLDIVLSFSSAPVTNQCYNRLREIDYALRTYAATRQHLPPINTSDKNGKPMHSWRVAILPYLGRMDLYDMYDFHEPWDGPKNRKLLKTRSPYTCPFAAYNNTPELALTNFVAVVGEKTFWQPGKRMEIEDLDFRGSSNTILLIEMGNSDIFWSEPRDFCLSNGSTIATNPPPKFCVPHMRDNGYFYLPTPLGANALFADGTVRFLPANMLTPDKLERLFAIGGYDENLDRDDSEPEDLQINWYNCIMLALWVLSVVALLYWAIRTRQTQ